MSPLLATNPCKRHRFPVEIISHGVRLYLGLQALSPESIRLAGSRDKHGSGYNHILSIDISDDPETITVDGSKADTVAVRSYNKEHRTAIAIRQVKYLNTIVEQDHRGVKRVIHPMLGFTSFDVTQCTLARIKLVQMLRKG